MMYKIELLLWFCMIAAGVASDSSSTLDFKETSFEVSPEVTYDETSTEDISTETYDETSTEEISAETSTEEISAETSAKSSATTVLPDPTISYDVIPKQNKTLKEFNEEVSSLNLKKISLEAEIKKLQDVSDDLKAENNEYEIAARVQHNNNTQLGPVDCADLLMSGITTSGIYYIYPFACKCRSPMRVYCDMETDGGGWTVFLKREDQTPHVNFNRTWQDYKYGFGNPSGEYWLGNENLHLLTNSRVYIFRMDLTYTAGVESSLLYNSFSLKDETNRYFMNLGTRMAESTIHSDCLHYFRARYFSTYDRDNEAYAPGNVAYIYGSGFWFYGHRSLVQYEKYPPTSPYGSSLKVSCHNSVLSNVKTLQLKIRPSMCEVSSKRIRLPHHDCENNQCSNSN